ncbi:biogenesis of lysosome-related organelles complex 1 subunit 5-like [Choloepus didactylus]|uniref:biogenesis of lysosome-related organelles complex 1 subunit 5-like n=1 Tax=Choloepus didactylus TaxID=27675 RepID=UPI00189EBF60|nr:biogenesis of lysosome-related organelles complex 1 subunit 5-like [Choloepus didactylus]
MEGAEPIEISGGGMETQVGCGATPGGSGKKRVSPGTVGLQAHLIIRDLGEIHSRLLDHRPVIQGETRYFLKEFEEKHGLQEMRVLENLKNMIHKTNEHSLPKCGETVQDNLNQVLQKPQAANHSVCRLPKREQEQRKIHSEHLIASEKQHAIQWEDFMKEQHNKWAEVDKEQKKIHGET